MLETYAPEPNLGGGLYQPMVQAPLMTDSKPIFDSKPAYASIDALADAAPRQSYERRMESQVAYNWQHDGFSQLEAINRRAESMSTPLMAAAMDHVYSAGVAQVRAYSRQQLAATDFGRN